VIVASRERVSRECRSRDGRSRNGRSRDCRCIAGKQVGLAKNQGTRHDNPGSKLCK
jgi:hypothetical protein